MLVIIGNLGYAVWLDGSQGCSVWVAGGCPFGTAFAQAPSLYQPLRRAGHRSARERSSFSRRLIGPGHLVPSLSGHFVGDLGNENSREAVRFGLINRGVGFASREDGHDAGNSKPLNFLSIGARGCVGGSRRLKDNARQGELGRQGTHRSKAGAEVVKHAQTVDRDEEDGAGRKATNEIQVGERVAQRGKESAGRFDDEHVGGMSRDPFRDDVELNRGACASRGEVRGHWVRKGIWRRRRGRGAYQGEAR